jgi:UDP-N-acetylmuramoyl-tripeptide--D-alanyl-D-alanine ligase
VQALSLGRLAAGADEITGVQVDSRRVAPGDLFVAVGGGEAYLEDARSHGAAATLVPADAHAALAALAGAVRARSDARVVAITGSVGKTSTKDILAALLRPHLRTVAAEHGFNNEVGLPLTLCRIAPDTEVVVTEMAMRAPGQIRDLARVARPHLGVITSIAPVHLALLGSLENIARAKAELLEELPVGSVAVLPEDAPVLEPFVPEGLDVHRFARPEAEVRDGRTYVRWRGREVAFGFTARHQASNAAAALTVVEALGLEPPREPVDVVFSRWRSQETELPGGGLLLNDAWNANPVAMEAALAHLLERAHGRRTVAILGDMAELGQEAVHYHEEAGRAAAVVDVVVGVGELARHYDPDEWAPTAAEAVELVRRVVRPGDAVLVKGSRSVGLEVVASSLVEPSHS